MESVTGPFQGQPAPNEIIPLAAPHQEKLAGAHLAWKDLRVEAPWRSNTIVNTLLDGLTGYAEPGSITAIMGPSGSGKSTLLDALAGRLSKTCSQTGAIFLNGRKQKLSYGVAAYVTQDDTLLGTLTVHETIMFTAFFRLPDSMPRKQKMELVEKTIADMGLRDAAHTAIGNWHMKGCSGGERRRVSIALELLTKPRLLFLDEPTSGLDSAAAFFVTTTLRNLARGGRTVIASVHQPSSEVFELFDNLCLLSGGRTVYFGATLRAHQHFVDSGIPCPPWRNPADHFLRAINSDFDRVTVALQGSLESKQDDLEQPDSLNAISTAERVEILVNHYRSSEVAMIANKRVREISQMDGSILEPSGTEASTVMQTFILTRRSALNMSRDLGYYWLRLVVYSMLCLTVGSVFYQVGNDYDAIQQRAFCLSFVVAFLTFMSIGSFPSFVEEMKVFTRERLNGHYGVAAFVISNSLASIPFLALTAVVSGSVVYFLAGLHPGFNHYIYFVLIIFSTTSAVEGLMMAIASVVPNFLVGILLGAGIQGVYMLNGGFFRLPNDIPKPVWRYPVSYIAFHTYGFQGVFQNDFLGLNFRPQDYPHNQQLISGEQVLRQTFQVHSSRDKWLNLGILFVQIALYRIFFLVMIKANERLGPALRTFLARRRASKEAPSTPLPLTSAPLRSEVKYPGIEMPVGSPLRLDRGC